jgi:hypothetical protein
MVLVSSSEDGERETTTTTRDSSSSSTLNRLIAIANFLKLHQPLWRAHVVEFFQEKLWEKVDPRWLACLQAATVKDWLLLPSGIAQDDWLSSLKEFVRTAHSLALQRQPKTATNGTELSLTIITPKSPSCFSPLLMMLET